MKEGLIKNTYEAVIKEIQTILALSYVLAVGIGMLFSYQKFSEFGINIFDYADVLDFLVAPFSDLRIFLFTVVSLAMTYLFLRLDLAWRKKFPKLYSKMSFGWDKKAWYQFLRYFSFTLLFIFYLYMAADRYGAISREQVMGEGLTSIRYSDNEIKKGKMIGKTKDVIFLLAGDRVEAIPISSLVKEIEISR